jgi:aminoglycoside phosphotransferase (APT) family kinase protein
MHDAQAPVGQEALKILSRRVMGGAQVVDTRRLSGGFSSDNVLVRTDSGESFVVRRYPRRNLCAVEAAVLALVAPKVSVPEVVYADAEGDLLGEPMLVTRFEPGVPLTTVFAGAVHDDGPALARVIGQALAAVHSVQFDEPGFFSDGSLRSDGQAPAHHDDLAGFVAAALARGGASLLTEADGGALTELAERWAPLAARAVAASRQLVHCDFNPKNILMRPGIGAWKVSAVLDWEYAFAGCGLFDLANMLRFPRDLGPGFADAFPGEYVEAGGVLPEDWVELSEALDLFALSDLLTRGADHPVAVKAADAIRIKIHRFAP